MDFAKKLLYQITTTVNYLGFQGDLRCLTKCPNGLWDFEPKPGLKQLFLRGLKNSGLHFC